MHACGRHTLVLQKQERLRNRNTWRTNLAGDYVDLNSGPLHIKSGVLTMFKIACRTCNTIILPDSTNQIIVFRLCRLCRLNSLATKTETTLLSGKITNLALFSPISFLKLASISNPSPSNLWSSSICPSLRMRLSSNLSLTSFFWRSCSDKVAHWASPEKLTIFFTKRRKCKPRKRGRRNYTDTPSLTSVTCWATRLNTLGHAIENWVQLVQ